MRRPYRALIAVGVLLLMSSLFVAVVEYGTSSRASAVSADFSITTNPPLIPAFNPSVLNYVVRCTSSPTTSVATVGTGQVTVGGTNYPGPVELNVPLVAGQGLQISNGGTSYYLRCLPSDFPTYTASVSGQSQRPNGNFLTIGHYAVVFDADGVPVWWYKDADAFAPFDAKFLSPTTIAYSDGYTSTYYLRGLDGSLQSALGGVSNPLDFHDLQLLPNGDYLGIKDVTRNCPADPTQCVDLSSWGLSSQATIIDNVIVEVNPANRAIWQWSVADHIDVAAANVNWHSQFPDVIHMNSILYDGNGGIIFSNRHLDAVYRIDMTTGAITWKLGGSPEPESLNVVGDQYLAGGGQLFSGQHFARLAPDGSLTVSDNGTLASRSPRGLDFTIDTFTNTATEVAQITDPRSTFAFCCGSAEELSGGDWIISWGGNDLMTELNPQGVPQFTITFPGSFSYRAADVPVSVDALRQGMDAMVPPLTDIPSTSVLLPSNGATLLGNQYLIAAATDGGVLTSVEFHLTGGTFNNTLIATGTPTLYGWLATWNTAYVLPGTYTLQSEAYDAAGSNSFSPPVTITVAAQGPTTAMVLPASGSTLTGTQFLSASATDPLGVSSVTFLLTGGTFNNTLIATGTPTLYGWLAAWNTATVPNGTYTIQSFATGTSGLTTESTGNLATVANPSVSAISPVSGTGSGGTKVVITGTGFNAATGVLFGAVHAASFTVNSKTRITAYSPPETAATVDVTVTAPGTSSYTTAADRYTFLPPKITKVSPTSGPTAGGTSVTITGANLTGATSVRFGGIAASTVTVVSPTKIIAYSPAQSAGTVDVTVTTPGGVSAHGIQDYFTYH